MNEPDADADLIDRLYAGGGDSELDGLRVVRGLVARVRDEMPGVEPPQAISARLLQAAETPVRAAAVEPVRAGLWTRFRAWFGGVAMHPGMAAAATLVIVAGAAAIWMRQGGKAATPTTSSDPVVGADQAAISPDRVDEVEQREEEPAPVEVQRDLVVKEKSPPRKPPPAKSTAPADEDKGDAFADKGGEASGSGSAGGPAHEAPTPTVTTKVGGTKQTSDSPTTTSPPPPPSEDPMPAPDDSEGGPSDAELARQLTQKAIAAAKKQDCESVAYFAKKVKTLDPDYYATAFVPQADIAACRPVAR